MRIFTPRLAAAIGLMVAGSLTVLVAQQTPAPAR